MLGAGGRLVVGNGQKSVDATGPTREVRSHEEQPTRSQVDWEIGLTRSQVLDEEQPTRSQAAMEVRKLSFAVSDQPTLFGVYPPNQTQARCQNLFVHI